MFIPPLGLNVLVTHEEPGRFRRDLNTCSGRYSHTVVCSAIKFPGAVEPVPGLTLARALAGNAYVVSVVRYGPTLF